MLQTRGVLAGAYKGKRAALDKTHTHLVDTDDASGGFDALCGKVKSGNMADECANPEGNDKEPTCPHCASIWRKEQGGTFKCERGSHATPSFTERAEPMDDATKFQSMLDKPGATKRYLNGGKHAMDVSVSIRGVEIARKSITYKRDKVASETYFFPTLTETQRWLVESK